MDILDIFWNLSQDEILDDLASSHADAATRSTAAIRRLQDENRDLRIQISLIVDLLVRRGEIRAEEFISAVAAAKEKLALAPPPVGKKIQKPPLYQPLRPVPPKA